jgi:hypothetical protein
MLARSRAGALAGRCPVIGAQAPIPGQAASGLARLARGFMAWSRRVMAEAPNRKANK